VQNHKEQRRDVLQILAMVATLAVPAFFTLRTVVETPWNARPAENPSPLGYTVSLTLFLIPVLAIGFVHVRWPRGPVHLRSLFWATGAIALIGFLLDIVFGYSFLTFKNAGATIGIRLPSWDWTTLQWVPGYLPVEEFAFYILGALFVLMLYLWLNDRWLARYDPHDIAQAAKDTPRLLNPSFRTLGVWLALTAAGVWYKFAGPRPEGFPGYFLFIMVLGFLPTFLFLRAVSPFVNWRAFAFSYGVLLLVSLVWEATLGVPYDWWNYKYDQMLGIEIMAWSRLPIEAVMLWMVIAWDCVIALEIFRVFFHMERGVKAALLGAPKPAGG
jgi:hypothetical protein